jgi:hypothetical protein
MEGKAGTDGVLRLEERRVILLGKMERFRDQGRALCHVAHCHNTQGRPQEAARCFQRARDIGAAHGFFSVECKSCEGLGYLAMREGRHQEGVDLLRNALAGPCPRLPSTLYPNHNPTPRTPKPHVYPFFVHPSGCFGLFEPPRLILPLYLAPYPRSCLST